MFSPDYIVICLVIGNSFDALCTLAGDLELKHDAGAAAVAERQQSKHKYS